MKKQAIALILLASTTSQGFAACGMNQPSFSEGLEPFATVITKSALIDSHRVEHKETQTPTSAFQHAKEFYLKHPYLYTTLGLTALATLGLGVYRFNQIPVIIDPNKDPITPPADPIVPQNDAQSTNVVPPVAQLHEVCHVSKTPLDFSFGFTPVNNGTVSANTAVKPTTPVTDPSTALVIANPIIPTATNTSILMQDVCPTLVADPSTALVIVPQTTRNTPLSQDVSGPPDSTALVIATPIIPTATNSSILMQDDMCSFSKTPLDFGFGFTPVNNGTVSANTAVKPTAPVADPSTALVIVPQTTRNTPLSQDVSGTPDSTALVIATPIIPTATNSSTLVQDVCPTPVADPSTALVVTQTQAANAVPLTETVADPIDFKRIDESFRIKLANATSLLRSAITNNNATAYNEAVTLLNKAQALHQGMCDGANQSQECLNLMQTGNNTLLKIREKLPNIQKKLALI